MPLPSFAFVEHGHRRDLGHRQPREERGVRAAPEVQRIQVLLPELRVLRFERAAFSGREENERNVVLRTERGGRVAVLQRHHGRAYDLVHELLHRVRVAAALELAVQALGAREARVRGAGRHGRRGAAGRTS